MDNSCYGSTALLDGIGPVKYMVQLIKSGYTNKDERLTNSNNPTGTMQTRR